MSIGTAGAVAADVPALRFLAPAHSTGMLALAIVFTVAGFALLRYTEHRLAPPRPAPAERVGALRRESPAVVNVLTNDATLTAAGFRATVIDLAARGWLRILPPDEDDELARVRPAATAYNGDSLLPHERLVLQHVMARFTTDRAIPARYLAVDVRGSWWRRFDGLVVDEAEREGLVRRRWGVLDYLPLAALALLAAMMWWYARGRGPTDIAVIDSIERRLVAAATLVAIVVLVVRIVRHVVSHERTHTEAGVAATERWLAVRRKLVEGGFGTMAASALEIGDRRLAYATAMCLAEGAATELPLAREDHYRAWSSVGGQGRLVRVRYPARIGYGLHPAVALVGGVVACFLGLWLHRWATDVAEGEALGSIYERFPDQDWLIADLATALAVLAYAPILIGLWVALAGAADAFNTVERTGVVLRTRRPAEVAPLPRFLRRLFERDRFTLFIAVDDGSRPTVVAWRSGERQAVPQGATATVRASPVLGHIRKATPVGHVLPE